MSHLISFRDGSYKKVVPVAWKHSQWIHFDMDDGSCVMVNPENVNYIHRDIEGKLPLPPDDWTGIRKEPSVAELMGEVK